MMKIKKGMYVKLREDNSCGCDDCERACSDYHRVVAVGRSYVRLEYGAIFRIWSDFHLKIESLENK